MADKIEMSGHRFGRLLVLHDAGFLLGSRAVWHCRCDCGNTVDIDGKRLRSGHTKSCGCLRAEKSGARLRTHGMSDTRIYWVWAAMVGRCHRPSDQAYPDYGARGITVCDEWRNSFEAFYRDMGDPPEGATLERKENDGPYCKENCEWVSRKTQNNNKRSNRVVEYGGESATLAQWSRRLGIKYDRLKYLLNSGRSMGYIIKLYRSKS